MESNVEDRLDALSAGNCSGGLDIAINFSASEPQASYCLVKEHGMFFDACHQKCHQELNFLRLSQSLELESFVYGKLFPVLVLFVVVANVLVALVLSQKHMASLLFPTLPLAHQLPGCPYVQVSPTNVVLKYMAIADLCVGLVPLPWNFFYHTLKHSDHEEDLQLWWCYMYKYSMDAVPPVFHNIAMWLTVLLAGQRYISIRNPLASRELCSVKNVRLATTIITVVSVLCGLPKSLDYYFEVYEGWAFVEPGRWMHMRTCLSGFTELVKIVGSNTFFNIYFWTRVFGFIVLPSVLLIILNVLLIRGIHQAQKRKNRLLREKRVRDAQRQIDSNSTSIMLVVIVSIFLIVNLPQAVFMALICVHSTFEISNELLEGMFSVTFLLVSNMLVMVEPKILWSPLWSLYNDICRPQATYPINFGIYCFMSSSFRETFMLMFCSRKYWQNISNSTNIITQFHRMSVRSPRRSDPSVNTGFGTFRYSVSGVSSTKPNMVDIDNCAPPLMDHPSTVHMSVTHDEQSNKIHLSTRSIVNHATAIVEEEEEKDKDAVEEVKHPLTSDDVFL